MMTNKDGGKITSQNLLMYLRNGHVEDDEDGDPDIVFEIETHDAFLMIEKARAETAEQAVKQALERAVLFYQRDCGGCGERCGECSHTRQLRVAILGEKS